MTRRRSSDMPALGALPATPAGFGAVLHLVPVPGPALAPAHWPAAGQAGLAGQGGFIALEWQGGPAHGCLLISGGPRGACWHLLVPKKIHSSCRCAACWSRTHVYTAFAWPARPECSP